MSVTDKDVGKMSHLACIKLEASKINEIRDSLNEILHFIEQLKSVDCSMVDDTVQYVTSMHERQDLTLDCDYAVMDNAPEKNCDMFVVPKVVG